MFRPEILAPAGNLFKLKTAVRYGADAVYLAGREFGLRSAADNFSDDEIIEGCAFAHQHGVKIYVVLNGFLFDEELSRLPPFLKTLEQAGVDAVIVSDLGVVETVRTHSRIPVHLSTQASALNRHAARFWKRMGVQRIVLGREVAIEEAARIKEAADIEVELFIHGAMCMAFSGHCTISNYTAGRDSNRGGCVQSCRFKYTLSDRRAGSGPDGFFLSSKDLRGLQYLPEFARYGIDSLKIEGRMKSALYVATTVRAYRSALDAVTAGEPVPDHAYVELETMSHRDYTDGNLAGKAGYDSVFQGENSMNRHTHDLLGHVLEVEKDAFIAVQLKNPLTAGEPVFMLGRDGETHHLETSPMRDLAGMDVPTATPNRVVLFPYHPLAEKDLLLRRHRHAPLRSHAT